MIHKEVREIVKKLRDQGWRVEEDGKTHQLHAYPPDRTKPMVPLPSTPGRGRWKQNLISELRRSGAVL